MRERQLGSTTHPISFLMVLSSDHITGATGLVSGSTLTVTISKDGGSFASPAGAVSEIGNGWYALAGNATDRGTLGQLILHATGTGADPTDRDYTITGYDPFDGVHLGITALPNATPGAAGGLFIAGTNAATTVTTSFTATFTGNLTGSVGSIAGVAFPANFATLKVDTSGYAYLSGPFKVNQAAGFEFSMVQSTDHATAFTAGGVSAVRSIAGGPESAVAGGVAQVGTTNRYYFSGLAADFNGTSIGFTFSANGADNVVISVNTQP